MVEACQRKQINEPLSITSQPPSALLLPLKRSGVQDHQEPTYLLKSIPIDRTAIIQRLFNIASVVATTDAKALQRTHHPPYNKMRQSH